MRESKKDKRDHKYGKLHRKDRQLHDEFKKKANAIWRKYLKEYVDTGKVDRYSDEASMAYYNARNAASDIYEKIEELWKESGLNWNEGTVEFCRYRHYHGYSNQGYVHADFIKKRDKEFERKPYVEFTDWIGNVIPMMDFHHIYVTDDKIVLKDNVNKLLDNAKDMAR